MKINWHKLCGIGLAFGLLLSGGMVGQAVDGAYLECAIADTAAVLCRTAATPQMGSIGGEWAVLGLARGGCDVPAGYYQEYQRAVEEAVTACGGKLHDKKYTEYSRVTLAMTAIGADPADVAGYNLLVPLGDFDQTVWQGINGAIWALIALDSGDYDIPQNPEAQTQATREGYIAHILHNQNADGGIPLYSGGASDAGITGMALQALAKYAEQPEVKQAVENALAYLSEQQTAEGGFVSEGVETAESSVQVLVGLCELGISPEDSRFVKNGISVLDNLLSYWQPGEGFQHTHSGDGSVQMATEQGLYGLVAVRRLLNGQNSLLRMSDKLKAEEVQAPAIGLPGKYADVQAPLVQESGKSFADIVAHPQRQAIEALAERGVINGKENGQFAPADTMTRAEFAAITVNALGLSHKTDGAFEDVAEGDWFYSYVQTACAYGLVNGVSAERFDPDGLITREQAAVMLTRAARLCGMNPAIDAGATRDALAGYVDYVQASDWAMASLAFCSQEGILPGDALELQPQQPALRADIAGMVYRLLMRAKLLN